MSPQPSPSPSPTVASRGAPISLYVAGVGTVGSTLLRQLDARASSEPPLRLVGVCTSRRALWVPEGLSPGTAPAHLREGEALDWSSTLETLTQHAPRPLVFVDATGSSEVAELYGRLFRAGIHVVTPSKIANARSQSAFDRLQVLSAEHDVQYRYETTVGAGLPVLQTVRDLTDTGDRIQTIQGAVSGTLTFLFHAMRNGSAFSEAVRAAIDRGYAEPDVRDDLSGEDVVRKFLILARTIGYKVERDDVRVESLVPDTFADLPLDDFLARLDTVNAKWQERSRAAASENAVLQYVGRLSTDGIDVGVRRVSKNDAFGRLKGQNNLFEIRTQRYAQSPLTIQGPGAGPEVTAAGVLADILQVARVEADHSS